MRSAREDYAYLGAVVFCFALMLAGLTAKLSFHHRTVGLVFVLLGGGVALSAMAVCWWRDCHRIQ